MAEISSALRNSIIHSQAAALPASGAQCVRFQTPRVAAAVGNSDTPKLASRVRMLGDRIGYSVPTRHRRDRPKLGQSRGPNAIDENQSLTGAAQKPAMRRDEAALNGTERSPNCRRTCMVIRFPSTITANTGQTEPACFSFARFPARQSQTVRIHHTSRRQFGDLSVRFNCRFVRRIAGFCAAPVSDWFHRFALGPRDCPQLRTITGVTSRNAVNRCDRQHPRHA